MPGAFRQAMQAHPGDGRIFSGQYPRVESQDNTAISKP